MAVFVYKHIHSIVFPIYQHGRVPVTYYLPNIPCNPRINQRAPPHPLEGQQGQQGLRLEGLEITSP